MDHSEYYEARREAAGEAMREMAADSEDWVHIDDVPDVAAEIESGNFDDDVKKRIKELFKGWSPGERHRFYEYLVEGLG